MHNNLKLKDNVVAYDTETTGIVPYGDPKRWGFHPSRPFAFSFYDTEGNSAYFRKQVDPFTREVLPDKSIDREVSLLLNNPRIKKVGHNLSFDIRMSKFAGLPFIGPIDDTIIMAHVMTGGDELAYGLKELGVKYLGVDKDDETELRQATIKARNAGKKLGWRLADKEYFGKDPIKADYWMAPPELCKRYAIRDAERTMMFWLMWYEDLHQDENLRRVYAREMKVFRVVQRMENRGTRVFPEDLVRLRKFYGQYMTDMLKMAEANGGRGLNFKSPKQMVKKFITEKGYEPTHVTNHGNPQINGDFLKAKADHGDKLAKAILEYRAGSQMLTAFLNPYDRFRVEESAGVWVLHPNYRQCGPVTGRFSCGDPNLMQVASETTGRRRTEMTLRPREAFGPRPGYVWYLPDYSQIEVWIFSFLAREDYMMRTLLEGKDFHGSIAERVWGDMPDYKTNASYYRKRAKLLMFCKLYGGGVKKVAYLIDGTIAEAQEFVYKYDSELPGVQIFMRRTINRAEREGVIYNPFGRMYRIDPRLSYRAVNYLVQGSAADVMKEALIAVDNLFQTRWKGCHILLTLHDELVIEVPLKYHSKKLMREITQAMQGNTHTFIGCPVPLPVSVKYTFNRWNKTTDIKL